MQRDHGQDGTRPIIFPEKHAGVLFSEDATFKALKGGRGTAKSTSAAIYIILRMDAENVRVACLRRFQNSIRQSSKRSLERAIERLGLSHRFYVGRFDIVNKATGAEAFFQGIERNADDTARGLEDVDIFYIDEAHAVTISAFNVILPTLRKSDAEMILCWNPRDPEDAPDKLFLPGGLYASESVVCDAQIEDNPYFYVSPMARQMQLMKQQDNDLYQHIWRGAYDTKRSDRIFTIQVRELSSGELRGIDPVYGMDLGYVDDPTVVVKVYVIEYSKTIYVAKCAHEYGCEADDLPDLIDEVIDSRGDTVICDTNEQRTTSALVNKGFNLVNAEKGPGSVVAGVRWLRGYQIAVHPDCELIQDEARLYRWKVDRATGKRTNVPVKGNDHSWDAVRYATQAAQAGEAAGEAWFW
ncbi:PBSX family phage terminase large subunit [Mesorhizobium sp. ORM8.1]